jgi:hypothetical protein
MKACLYRKVRQSVVETRSAQHNLRDTTLYHVEFTFLYVMFSSCENQYGYTYAIKDFRKSLQPFLVKIVSEGNSAKFTLQVDDIDENPTIIRTN